MDHSDIGGWGPHNRDPSSLPHKEPVLENNQSRYTIAVPFGGKPIRAAMEHPPGKPGWTGRERSNESCSLPLSFQRLPLAPLVTIGGLTECLCGMDWVTCR